MTHKRKTYSREFKLEAVRLSRTSGRRIRELERELGIGSGCLSRWRQEFANEGEDAFPGRGKLSSDKERMRELEREVEILRQDRDILKKAVAIFTHPK